jgi:hypothetical protein
MCFNYISRLENSVEITPENLQNTADEHVRWINKEQVFDS